MLGKYARAQSMPSDTTVISHVRRSSTAMQTVTDCTTHPPTSTRIGLRFRRWKNTLAQAWISFERSKFSSTADTHMAQAHSKHCLPKKEWEHHVKRPRLAAARREALLPLPPLLPAPLALALLALLPQLQERPLELAPTSRFAYPNTAASSR